LNPAVIIYTDSVVDPAFLYGLNRDIPVFVVSANNPHLRVNRPNAFIIQREQWGEFNIAPDAPFIGGKSSRALGFLKAAQQGFDLLIAISDTCIIPRSIDVFYSKAFEEGPQYQISSPCGWVNTIGNKRCFSRGFPFQYRTDWSFELNAAAETISVAHYGLWRGCLDQSAITTQSLDYVTLRNSFSMVCSDGNFFIPSAINCAFKKSNLFLSYCPPVPMGDIIGGLITQSFLSRRKERITFGKPIVRRVSPELDVEGEVILTSIIDELMSWLGSIPVLPKTALLESFSVFVHDMEPALAARSLSPLASLVLAPLPGFYTDWVSLLQGTSL
jgi:hypothetical protein